MDTADDFKEDRKLTKWENEPSISDLKQNLDDAAQDNDAHLLLVDKWLENLSMTGAAKPIEVEGNSSVGPKVIRRQAEWRYSSLAEPFLSTPDIFNVHPITAGDRKRAKQNELVLNNQFNTKINKVAFIDTFVRDAVDIGTVIVKVGWDTEETEVTEEVPIYQFTPEPTGQLAEKYAKLVELKQTNLEGYLDYSTPGLDQALDIFVQQGIAVIPHQIDTKTITQIKETKNQPTVNIPDIHNLIIDPSCDGDTDKANFIGEKFKSSLSELRKDGKYTNLDSINVEAASPLANPDYEENADISTFNFIDNPRKQFVVHEYWGTWDINNTGIVEPIVAAWVNDTMIRMEPNPFPDKKPPFVCAVYMPVRRSVFGEPDGALIEENQQIIGAVTRGMIDLLGKSASGQTGMRKDLLDITNQRKYKRGDDYEFNANVDPRQGIYPHVYPEIPQSAYNMITLQNADAESLSGVKAFSTGITGQSLGNVATGVRSAMDAASKRETGILRRLAYGVVQVGRKFISMNAEWLSDEEVIRITDKEFVNIRRDDLPGNFDLRLSISTAEEDNKKAEELAFMLQTMGNNMDPELSKMILSDIARLRKMPDMAQKIEDYNPQPNPFQQKKMELEIKLLEAQIAKESALAAKHGADAEASGARGFKDGTQGELNLSKAGTEGAKSRHLSSDADRKDLDYLEEESGVGHARELQKIDAKAKNEMATKAVEAMLDRDKPKETQPKQ